MLPDAFERNACTHRTQWKEIAWLSPCVCMVVDKCQPSFKDQAHHNHIHTTFPNVAVADLGGVRGVRPHPLGVLQKNSWSTNFENSEESRQHDYYYYQFYLAASSHEIFLRVGGREGMKGLGALQRHQLPHPPLQKSWIRHWNVVRCHTTRKVAWCGCGVGMVCLVFGRRLTLVGHHDTIRYDTRCYFNVRSKADISQLNLPHGTDN